MVKLCTHHQKQFIRVLSDLYTESQPGTEDLQPSDSRAMETSTCSAACVQLSNRHKEQDAVCLGRKSPSSVDSFMDSSGSHSSLHVTEQIPKEPPPEIISVDGRDNALTVVQKDSPELAATQPNSGSSTNSSALGYLTAPNSSSVNFHYISKSLEGQTTAQEQDTNMKTCEDGKDHVQSSALIESLVAVKKTSENSEEGNSCIVSQRNSFKALSEERWDSGFMGNSPRSADKENALQSSSKTPLCQDLEANEQDARPKQENHLHSLGRSKVGYHSHPSDKAQFDHSKDGWLVPSSMPAIHRASNGHSRNKMISPSIKTARKSKRASGLRINDYDNQCDVVYISQPITECHFETQRSLLSSRKTARKSTRGYFFNGDCCELPTVRTLARNLHSQDKGSSSLASAAVVTPNPDLIVPSPRCLVDVQLPREDSPEEPSKEITSLREKSRDTSPAKESQDPEVRPTMSEPNSGSSPRSTETTASSVLCHLSGHLPDKDMLEGNSVVSAPTTNAVSSPERDQQPRALLDAVEVNVLQDFHLLPTTDSISREGGEDLLRPQSSPETVSREESLLCSENQSSPMALDPPLNLGQAERNQSISTEAQTGDTQELGTDSLLLESSTFSNENLGEIEGDEGGKAASSTGQLEEVDSDLKYSSEKDMCGPNSDSPEENSDKKKRGKKFLETSDRCLRSQLSESSSADRCLGNQSSDSSSACLEVQVSKNPGAKHSKKEDSGGTTPEDLPADSVPIEDLEDMENLNVNECPSESDAEQEGEGGGIITRQAFKSMLAKEVQREEGGPFPNSDPRTAVGQPLHGERLEIYVQSKVSEKDAHLPSESMTYKRDPEQSKERPGHRPAQEVEAAANEVDSEDTQQKDDAKFVPSGSCGISGSQGEDTAEPPKLVARPKRLTSSTYNLRHAHSLDSLDMMKVSSEKEGAQVNPMPRESEGLESADPLDEDDVDTVVDEQPKFVEWCAEEENQELIANFNAQYMKVQKGWIQLEKEAQPTARARNKSDKLKEIWKSKKRSRKCRGALESQRISPVQMLFMTNFKLSNVCKWFLETTETRSLVIVKKLNTRLPGDIPPVKHPLQKYSPSSLYPSSLQAERLKKHLKKFPGATPARNNWKTQKLWAKLRESSDQVEPDSSSDVSLGPNSEDSVEVKEGRNSHPPTNSPTPASTRILRKYSNIRGKLRAQQRLINTDNTLGVTSETKQSRKSVCINPLMSPKLALQVGADGFPVKPKSAEGIKGRKGKQIPEVLLKAEGQNKRKRTEGSGAQDSKDRGPAMKASKEKHVDGATRAPPAKRLATRDKTSQLPRKMSPKENTVRIPKKPFRKSCPSSRKEKENTNKKPTQTTASSEALRKSSKHTKQKGASESPSRPQKATNRKSSSGKTRTRPLTKNPESRAAQRKRKLKAKMDSAHNKRRRLDAK